MMTIAFVYSSLLYLICELLQWWLCSSFALLHQVLVLSHESLRKHWLHKVLDKT
jgi:hypothetical protein